MTLQWIINTRPDIACSVGLLAQIAQEKFEEDPMKHCKAGNKVVNHICQTPDKTIRFNNLSMTGLHPWVYADRAFANRYNSSPQLGYVLLIVDEDGKSCFLAQKSFKSRRVPSISTSCRNRSISMCFRLVLSNQDGILQNILDMYIPLHLFTNSKFLFDIITLGSSASNQRLMSKICALLEVYQLYEIPFIHHIRSKHNMADVLTKQTRNDALEITAFQGCITHPIELTVHRDVIASQLESHSSVDEEKDIYEAWCDHQSEFLYGTDDES